MKKKFLLVLYRDDIPFSKYIEHDYLGATSLRLDFPSQIPTLHPWGSTPCLSLPSDQTKIAILRGVAFFLACDLSDRSAGWRDLALQCGVATIFKPMLDSLPTVLHNERMNNNAFAAAVPTLFKMVLGQMHTAHRALAAVYGAEIYRAGGMMASRQNAARYNAIAAVLNADGILDDDKMVAIAMDSAKKTAAAMASKVAGKVGKLSGVTVRHVNGCEFDINGTDAAGRPVQLIQTTVYKFSPNGTMFAQFPCRIYVDGKFTAEANF